MTNKKQFVFLLFFNICHSLYCFKFDPIPPQPNQYITSILLNGNPAVYYSDTTIYKERLDEINENSITILDYKTFRSYVIFDGPEGSCSWTQIPGKIKPLLTFPTYEFNGNVTHNRTLCYKWNGCHEYEIPPAPFYYYATIKGNIPVDLNLPTIDVNIHFSNFTRIRPPSSLFTIPANCTETKYDQTKQLLFLYKSPKETHLRDLC